MDDLAKLKDGSFYFIEKVDDVGECFADCVGGLISVIAKDGVISVLGQNPQQLPPGSVKIKKAFGGEDLWSYNEHLGVFNTKITHLYSGASRDFVLELELGPTKPLEDFEKSMSVARAKCAMVGIDGEKYSQERLLKITLLNPDEESKEDLQEQKDVALQYYRVKVAEVMDIAQQLALAKDHKKATAVLQTMIKELKASKYKDDLLLTALVQDLEEAVRDVQPKVYQQYGRKRMKQKFRGHMEQRSHAYGGQ